MLALARQRTVREIAVIIHGVYEERINHEDVTSLIKSPSHDLYQAACKIHLVARS